MALKEQAIYTYIKTKPGPGCWFIVTANKEISADLVSLEKDKKPTILSTNQVSSLSVEI